ncbi:MAG: META domain-containing protein [Ignavibacterium sp.]
MKLFFLFLPLLISLTSCCTSSNTQINKTDSLENSDEQIVNPSFYQGKFVRGIDFFARGNEPNWTLEIDLEKGMSFSEMNGLEINTPAVKGVKAQDADVTDFRAQVESGEISVTIIKVECQDNMSGEMFDYNVRVALRKGNEADFTEFNGCGKYLYDYRLHDIWVMEEMTDVELKKENLTKGLPMFEFNLRDMRFSGHAGCNQIFGGIEVKGNKIRFGNLASTKMACPDMTVEQKVTQTLNSNTFTYRIEKLKLVLESDTGIKIVFRKID